MKTYSIPVSWTETAMIEIKAESLEEAVRVAMKTKLAEKTPTPETDEAQLLHFDEPVVPINFARRLERERNFYKQVSQQHLGGKTKFGETSEAALRREIREETGLPKGII